MGRLLKKSVRYLQKRTKTGSKRGCLHCAFRAGKLIKNLDQFMVLVARRWQKEAMRLMKPIGQDLMVSRPFECVEIDETKIELVTIMAQSDFLGMFTTKELIELELDNTKDRSWLVVQ